jgi:DNA-binding MarR family transcriptional regulator
MTLQPGTGDGVDGGLEPLIEASQVMAGIIVRSLSEVDATVTVPQLRVLVMASQDERVNVNAVAAELGVNASNASRTCARLVELGLLRRKEDLADRRHVLLSLTRSGERLIAAVMERRRREFAEIVANMAEVDRRRLMRSLRAFTTAAGDHRSLDALAGELRVASRPD